MNKTEVQVSVCGWGGRIWPMYIMYRGQISQLLKLC